MQILHSANYFACTKFSEVQATASNAQATAKIIHMTDAPAPEKMLRSLLQ
jgi:hypothetical protein